VIDTAAILTPVQRKDYSPYAELARSILTMLLDQPVAFLDSKDSELVEVAQEIITLAE